MYLSIRSVTRQWPLECDFRHGNGSKHATKAGYELRAAIGSSENEQADIASSINVQYCVLDGYLSSKLIFPISVAAVVPMQLRFIVARDERFLRILWCLFDGFSREVDKDL